MIVVLADVSLRKGPQIKLPGAPTSLEPLKLSAGLDNAELAFTEDSGRLFIGHTPSVNDVNYHRSVFPYQNLEVLTESSPRLRQLFGEFARDQNEKDFFVPVPVATAHTGPIVYTGTYDDDATIPTHFDGPVSATIEYHAFTQGGTPIKQGLLTVMGTTVADSQIVEAAGYESKLTFGGLTGGDVTCANTTGTDVLIYFRRVVIKNVTL